MKQITHEDIARVSHQLNKAYCESIGDNTQVDFENTPDWQRNSAIIGVEFHRNNPNASDSASHDSWLAEKVKEGWVYGEVKDAEAKTHPCIVPFNKLPLEQQIKDKLFRQTVHALLPLLSSLADVNG
jgi:hypothetical protein